MYLVNFISAKFGNLKIGGMGILSMFSAITQYLKKLGLIAIISLFYFNIGSAMAAEKTVGDNFPTVSYSENSGSENWSGNWVEVGESDGASAGIARVRSDLCSGSGGNCLRLGVPSGSARETYVNKGVYRELDLTGATSATLSFVYRRAHSRGDQTVVLSVYDGTNWIDLDSYRINTHNTSPISASFDISDYAASNTQIRFLATGNNAIIGMYIDDIEIKYEVPTKLSVTANNISQEYEVSSYGGSSQDRTGTVDIRDAGLSLFLEGNRWQKIDFPYTVTENTVIEFDFQSTVQGEVQGLGFDNDLSISSDRSFKVYGTQNWGLSDFATYSGSGVTHFTIPVGEFYTGDFQYLFFMNDDDSVPTSNSLYSNIVVHEGLEPIVEYRFDETNWSGTSEDVLDSSDNALHGKAINVQPASGMLCNAADFNRTNRIEVANNALLDVGDNNGNYTVNFWLNPRSIISGWSNIIHKGSIDFERTFAAWFLSGGSSKVYHRVSTTSSRDEGHTSNTALGLNTWTMVTLVKKDNQLMTYFNGTLAKQTSLAGSSISNNGPLYIGDDPWYSGIDALMDELTIFGSALSATEIQNIRTNNLAGNGWDGSERNCPNIVVTPIIEYRFEEDEWDGSADEVIDSSGNDYHGDVVRRSTLVNPPTEDSPAALTGDPGTCGYVSQNRGSIKVAGLNLPSGTGLDTTTIGAKTTVTFWMKWDGTNSVMPIGWNYHDIWIRDNKMGFNTWQSDIYGISIESPVGVSSAILANEWHHVAVEFTNGEVSNNGMHIDGLKKVLKKQRTSSPNNTNAYVKPEMRIGGVSNSSSYDFRGLLDEVRVYKGSLTTEQVVTIMNERHDCNSPTIHHYEISHDGQGLTCEAEPLTLKACTDESCSNVSAESVTLDILADGNVISSPTFTGSTTVNFNHTAPEILTFSVANATTTASDAVVCDNGTGTSCDMEFAEAGFRFLSGDGNSITIGNHTSGAVFNESLKLQAVKDVGGVCAALFSGNKNIDLSQENVAPGGTTGLSFTVNGAGIAKQGGVPSSTSTTLTFGTDSIATIPVPVYHDAGQIRLHANYSVGGVTLSGSSNAFWVSPDKLVVSAKTGTTNLNAASATATPIHSAGENFELTVSAYNAATPAAITPNYLPGEIEFKLARTGPTTHGENGTLTYGSNGSIDSQHSSTMPVTFQSVILDSTSTPGVFGTLAARYSEVGLLNLDVRDYNYAGENILIPSAEAINIGRFTPAYFTQTVETHGSLNAKHSLTGECSTESWVYAGQQTEGVGTIAYNLLPPKILITAYNAKNIITKNYTAPDFLKLLPRGVTVSLPTEDFEKNRLIPFIPDEKVNITSVMTRASDTTVEVESPGVISYEFNPTDHFIYEHNAHSKHAPFPAKIQFLITKIEDEDRINLYSGSNVDITPTVPVLTTGVEIRFGRLVLKNSFGPETSDLPQPLQVEHYDGTNFIVTSNNDCTGYDAAKLSLTDKGLDPALTDKLGGIGSFIEGKTQSIELEAPGAGNQGELDVTYDTFNWLKFDWDNDGSHDDNPSAVATFGQFRGNDRIIYIREVSN